ncbi:MAG TPA: vWA domain-containing protein [Kofleriaceae bacterium]|nr:vWA domain-containing protein [Kofleriaceae bacterium]
MLRTFASLAALSLPLLATAHTAAADQCTPARVLVVLDKSSSMVTGQINGVTKWDTAADGLGKLLEQYQTKAEFGLMTFPQPNQCGPGALDVAPALNNKASIISALGSPPPTSGNYTPMSQSLEAAANLSAMSVTGPKHVVLITDGWQYCVPYDNGTRFDGVDAIAALNAKGVTTWIVGFGGEVDALGLNKMAVAANTAKTGCNPTSEDAAAANNCYFQVDNAQELLTALNQIAGSVSSETCDGLDNDCDGKVDEDLTRACSNACGAGTETCHAGNWEGCTAPPASASTEVCDGVDNDCDGQTDEPGADLCDNGDVCDDGMCVPPNGEDDGGGMHAGCCDAGGAPTGQSLALFGLVGLALFARRRRR